MLEFASDQTAGSRVFTIMFKGGISSAEFCKDRASAFSAVLERLEVDAPVESESKFWSLQ
jgi:hypothetical protein